MDISAIWVKLQALLDLALAGALGAAASLPFHRDLKTLGQRLTMVASGAIAAHYITPLVSAYFGMDAGRNGGVAFLIGLFGMSTAAAVLRGLRTIDLAGMAKAYLPNKGE